MTRTGGLAALVFALIGCEIDDPDHCANRSGDATCNALGEGGYCSQCTRDAHGCVPAAPPSNCRVAGPMPNVVDDGVSTTTMTATTSVAGDAEGSSAGVDETSDAATDESGSATECAGAGLADDCPAERPYCESGRCQACADDAALCGRLDEAAPACHAAWGRCVECLPPIASLDEGAAEACGEQQWCGDDLQCGGCTRHEQCPGSACNMRRGECLPTDQVFYVDSRVCPDEGLGTEASPYCAIQDAVNDAEPLGTVIVRGGGPAYDASVNVILSGESSPTVALIGVQQPELTFATQTVPLPLLRVSSSTVMLANVTLRDTGAIADRCVQVQGLGRAWLDDVVLEDCTVGVAVDGGQVVIRRAIIRNNTEVGVLVEDEAKATIASSYIVNNGGPEQPTGGVLVRASDASIVYSTIVHNEAAPQPDEAPEASSLLCIAGGEVTVRNSVLADEDSSSVLCPWAEVRHSAVDTADIDGPNTLLEGWNDAWFASIQQGNARVGNAQSSPFADVGRWALGDPTRDLDGDRRAAIPDQPTFAGADQP